MFQIANQQYLSLIHEFKAFFVISLDKGHGHQQMAKVV